MGWLGSAQWPLSSTECRGGRSQLELEHPRWSSIVHGFPLVMLHCPVVKLRLLYEQQLASQRGKQQLPIFLSSELQNLRAFLPTYPIGQAEWLGQIGCEKWKTGVHRKGWISTGHILVLSTTYLQSHLAHVVRTGYVSGPSKLQPRNSYRIRTVDGCSVIKGKEIQMYDVPCMKPAHTRQSVSCRFTCLRCVERTTLRRSRGDWWLHMLGEDAMLTGNKHGRCYWGDENALKLDYAEMVTHFNVFIKNCWIVLLEAGNLMVCKSIFQ